MYKMNNITPEQLIFGYDIILNISQVSNGIYIKNKKQKLIKNNIAKIVKNISTKNINKY